MRHPFLIVALCAGAALGATALTPLHTAQAAVSEKQGGPLANHVTITRGKSRVIKVSDEIADVLVADPSVVEVGAIKNDKLYLIGASLGDTNVMIFDEDGNTIDEMDIHVRVDEKTLQNTLNNLFPNETIIAKTVNDDIMLTGTASNPSVAGRIEAATPLTDASASEQAAAGLDAVRIETGGAALEFAYEVRNAFYDYQAAEQLLELEVDVLFSMHLKILTK